MTKIHQSHVTLAIKRLHRPGKNQSLLTCEGTVTTLQETYNQVKLTNYCHILYIENLNSEKDAVIYFEKVFVGAAKI